MLFFTREGYFKKISPQSWRMGNMHKLKEGDEVIFAAEGTNSTELLFFTNRCQVYKSRAAEFEECKASVLGDFVASRLGMDEGETAVYMAAVTAYDGYMLFFFENGKVAKVDLGSYATKTNRRKLLKAYSDKSPLCACFCVPADAEFVLKSSAGRFLLFNSAAVAAKAAKDTQGVAVMTLKKGHRVVEVRPYENGRFVKPARYRTKSLPAAGMLLSAEDQGEQLKM